MSNKLDQNKEITSMEREQSYRDAKVKKEEAAYLEKLEKQTEL